MYDGGDKLEAVGLPAAHVESHFAPVGISLGDPVDGGCPFKLGEHHQDFYNQLSVRGGCVKGLLGRHEFYVVGLEFLKDVHKVRERAAHTVQLVYDYLADLILSDELHHFLEAVPVDVPSREPVIYEGKDFLVPFVRFDDGTTVFQLGLTADAVFPFYRFPGVEDDCHLTHLLSWQILAGRIIA